MKKALAMILAAGMMLAMAACGAAPVSSAQHTRFRQRPAQGEATRTYFINPKMVAPPIGNRPRKAHCRRRRPCAESV